MQAIKDASRSRGVEGGTPDARGAEGRAASHPCDGAAAPGAAPAHGRGLPPEGHDARGRLEHDEQRDAARQALRGFLERIVIPPGDGLLQVDGNLGAMLNAAQNAEPLSRDSVGYVGCGGGI